MPTMSSSSVRSEKVGARARYSSWRRSKRRSGCSGREFAASIWALCRAAGASTPRASSAPGGGTQSAGRITGGRSRIVATDILAMDAIPGVDFVQGDFREPAVLEQVLQCVGADKVDLVLSDMAPNMAGIDAVDQPRSMYLAELALEFADRVLAPGGDLLLKLFQGAGFDQIIKDTRSRYGRVMTKKPKASRSRSSEIYLLARQFGMV